MSATSAMEGTRRPASRRYTATQWQSAIEHGFCTARIPRFYRELAD